MRVKGLIWVMVILCLVSLVSAFSGSGSGTIADPYQITNWGELAETINERGANYSLMNDLDDTTQGWNNSWESLGDNTLPFTFNFYGNNYTISDYIISETAPYNGLFAECQGYIEKLGVENFSVSSNQYFTGALCARLNSGGIINQSYASHGVVINSRGADAQSGGFVGTSSGSFYYDCYTFDVNVTQTNNQGYIGGFTDDYNSFATYNNVYQSGTLTTGSSTKVGCLVNSALSISQSHYDSTKCSKGGVGTPHATSTMKEQSTYSGWDIKNYTDYTNEIWVINDTNHEPILGGFETFVSPSGSSTLDIILTDSSANVYDNNTFDENQHYIVFFNWTDDSDGSALETTDGFCNITIENAVFENTTRTSSFTLCTAGCDNSSVTEPFYVHDSNSSISVVNRDSLHVTACHTGTPNKDLDITFTCNDLSDTVSVDASSMDLCANANLTSIVSSTTCAGSEFINITLENTAGMSQSHLVSTYDINREFFQVTEINGTDVIMPSPTYPDLWEIAHQYEHIAHGTHDINVTCAHLTDSNFNQEHSEDIIISNIPPFLDFEDVNTTLGLTVLEEDNSTIIEFANGTWNFFVVVNDDDLEYVNVSIENSTGVFYTDTSVADIKMASDFFVDFSNPYKMIIWANDTGSNITTKAILFNVTDTSLPVTVTPFSNVTVDLNTTINVSALFNDEYIWSSSYECDNGQSGSETALAVSSYNYTISVVANQSLTTCNYNVSDGHTTNNMRNIDVIPFPEKALLQFEKKNLTFDKPTQNITYEKLVDRVSFCIETDVKYQYVDVNIPEGCVRAPNSPWKGHYVCDDIKIAIDFESDDDYVIESYSDMVRVHTGASKKYCFNSIVELNTLSGTFTVTGDEDVVTGFLQPGECPNSTIQDVLMLMFMTLLPFLIVFWNELTLQRPILNFVAGFCFVPVAWTMLACSPMFGGAILFLGILVWFIEAFRMLK